jgi:hypothetical protein
MNELREPMNRDEREPMQVKAPSAVLTDLTADELAHVEGGYLGDPWWFSWVFRIR